MRARKNFLKVWLCGLAFLTGAAGAWAGPLEDAQAAYAAGDYAKAMSLFRPAADQGNPIAQYNVGILYENGQGVPQDFRQAAEWYRKGADQGYSEAQNNLASLYLAGSGMPANIEEGVKWLRAAATQGHGGAQYNLGMLFAHGQGVTKDFKQAEGWLRLAADQGDADAKFNLGALYERGDGAPQIIEAYKWYLLAAEAGSAPAAEKKAALGGALTPEQKALAELQAADLKTALAPVQSAEVSGQAASAAAPTAAALATASAGKSSGGKASVLIFAVVALLAVAAAVWHFFLRFKPIKEEALLAGAANTVECDRIVHHYLAAGRAQIFVDQNRNRTPEFYSTYSRGFLKEGALPAALSLLELKQSPSDEDARLLELLKKAVEENAGAPPKGKAWPWNERFGLALRLSAAGLHAEAVSLINDEIRGEAAKDPEYAGHLSTLYKAAGLEIF